LIPDYGDNSSSWLLKWAIGSAMQNVVPESSLLSAQMRPPWFSTIDFAIVKQNTN
jgi:hypothetical protein